MFNEAQTVLVVDDEEAFLKVCQESLEVMGYRVFIAKEGKGGYPDLLRKSGWDRYCPFRYGYGKYG